MASPKASSDPVSVLFVTTELAPLARTGGLGEVAAYLPRALVPLGVDIRVLMPFYRPVVESLKAHGLEAEPVGERFTVLVHGELVPGRVHAARLPGGVVLYLLECERFFGRRGIYGEPGFEYPDNHLRFIYLCLAVEKVIEAAGFAPRIIHANEWSTGLIPAYIKTLWRENPLLRDVLSLFTIHNAAYQGNFPVETFAATRLPWDLFSPAGVEFYGRISFLKAAILFSDLLTTVSPRYREEILTPELGFGLDGVLKEREESLAGVLNGVDYGEWSPEGDPFLAKNYSISDPSGKAECKAALIEEMGLDGGLSQRPVLGVVSRLVHQKGVDLALPLLDQLLEDEALVVVLGSGEGWLEERLREARDAHPRRLGLRVGFDNALAHRIEAGADLFLMPSRYEPCGLNQLYSLRYGTVPVVSDTGGLRDTVADYDPGTGRGTGFKFASGSTGSLALALGKGLALYGVKDAWRGLMENGMGMDFSWEKSAASYLDLYRRLLEQGPDPRGTRLVSRGTPARQEPPAPVNST